MAKRNGRRGLRGLRAIKSGMARDLIPPAVGTVLTFGTALGVRAYLQPTPATASEAVYRNAPWIGVGAGLLGGSVMWLLGGKGAGLSTMVVSGLAGGLLYGMERLHASKAGAFMALAGESAALPSGTAGMRAIVPEYDRGPFSTKGLNAVMMERLNGNEQNQGADVQLRGVVNPSAFGTKPFGAR